MIEIISHYNSKINSFVWGVPALILFIGTGIFLSILTNGFQFFYFPYAIKTTIGSLFKNKDILNSNDKSSLSQFQSLCTALSATIGTGNIAGIAYAITMGGPGSVFWMWMAALLGMITSYSENVLGIYFRKKNEKAEWCGGAMYYLRDGLGSKNGCKTIGKILAILFALFTVCASFGIGNMSQVASIKESILYVFPLTENPHMNSLLLGLSISAAAALVILGGLTRIAKANERIVPFMACIYILGSLLVIFMHARQIIPAFASIFRNAFNIHAITGGIGGTVLKQAIIWGLKRGVFSNEAGLGSSVMVHCASNVKEPVTQGLWGIFEVFFDTIIICTLTALLILTTGIVDLDTGASFSGTTKLGLTAEAFTDSLGTAGGIFLALTVTLFAFSTILGWSYYGSKAWEYLFGTSSVLFYKLLFVSVVFAGSFLETDLIIALADTFNGLMAIPNLIGILMLSKTVVKLTNNYILSHFPDARTKEE